MLEIDFDLFLNCVIKHLASKTDLFVNEEQFAKLTPEEEDELWSELQIIAKG